MKKSFIERKRDRIIVYPFSALEEKIKIFKESQIDEIPKNKLFYRAVAADKQARFISERYMNYFNNGSDLFTDEKIGLHQNASFTWESEDASLYPTSNIIEMEKRLGEKKFYSNVPSSTKLDYKMQSEALENYFNGSIRMKPFRVQCNGKNLEYFLPTSTYDGTSKYTMYPIIHITRMAYLLELLQNNQMRLLKEATAEEFSELLELFSFREPREFSLNVIKTMREHINELRLAYGPSDPELWEFEGEIDEYTRMIIAKTSVKAENEYEDLIKRSALDMPFIEEVKRIALK